MRSYTAAIIGCGKRGAGRGGAFGIAEAHAQAYLAHPQTTLVAAADISAENLQARRYCERLYLANAARGDDDPGR